MKRIKTHIRGFDELIEGGFPKGANVLISGSAGTGKTIFSMQYLYNGFVKEKEKGIYFTFEEKKNSLIEQAKQFGWDFEKELKKKNIQIVSIGTENINSETINEVIEIIRTVSPDRIVIDSISTLAFLSEQDNLLAGGNASFMKKFIYVFLSKLNEMKDITTLVISQKDEKEIDNLVKYVCDGVIEIEYESLGGDFSRNLVITKMRKTKNNEDLHPLEISSKGVVIHNLE